MYCNNDRMPMPSCSHYESYDLNNHDDAVLQRNRIMEEIEEL